MHITHLRGNQHETRLGFGDRRQPVVLANFAPGVSGKTRALGDILPLGRGDGFVDLSDLGQVLADFGTDCR